MRFFIQMIVELKIQLFCEFLDMLEIMFENEEGKNMKLYMFFFLIKAHQQFGSPIDSMLVNSPC